MWKDQNSSSHVQAKSALGFPPWSLVPAPWPPVLPPWYVFSYHCDLHPKFSFSLVFCFSNQQLQKKLISAIFLIIIFSFICVVKLHCIFHCLMKWLKHLLWQKNKYFLWIPNKGCRRLNVIPFSNNQSQCWICCSNILPNLVITVFERQIQILRLFLKPWIRSFPKAWLMSR